MPQAEPRTGEDLQQQPPSQEEERLIELGGAQAEVKKMSPEDIAAREQAMMNKIEQILNLEKSRDDGENNITVDERYEQEKQMEVISEKIEKYRMMGTPEEALKAIEQDMRKVSFEGIKEKYTLKREIVDLMKTIERNTKDTLTGLINKAGSRDRMNTFLRESFMEAKDQAPDRKMEAFMEKAGRTYRFEMDAMGLKAANDVGSHATGDELIKKVAKILESGKTGDPEIDGLIESWDSVAREGGDEYSMMITFKESPRPEVVQRISQIVQEQVSNIKLENRITFSGDAEPVVQARNKIAAVYEKFGMDFETDFDPENVDYYKPALSVGAVNFGEALNDAMIRMDQEALDGVGSLDDLTTLITNRAYDLSDHRCLDNKGAEKARMAESGNFEEELASTFYRDSATEALAEQKETNKKITTSVREAVSELRTGLDAGDIVLEQGARQALERLEEIITAEDAGQ